MRKFPLLGAALFIPALALCVSAPGCSNKGNTPPPKGVASTTAPDTTKPAPAGGAAKLTAPTNGVVKGYVKFEGSPPKLVPNEKIASHADVKECQKGNEFEKSDQVWLVGKDNGVANVVVYLTPPAGKAFDVTADLKKPFEKPAVLDQPHCAFVPHVLALYPDAGQKLEVKNSAPMPHNTKITGDPLKNSAPLDKNLPPKSDETVAVKYQGKEPLRAVCNQHPWMNSLVFTFNNPYFAVTKDDGSFEIKNVPTGVELNVMVWHESFGNSLKEAKESEKKSFKAGENDVTLKIK
jgi:hypothetical protein